MKTWKKGLAAMAAAALLAGVFAGCGNSNSDEAAGSGNTVKFGFITAYTGPGAAYGQAMKDGVDLAVDEINKDPNTKYKIDLVTYDTKLNKTEAVNAMKKAIEEDKVLAVQGPMTSGEMFAAGQHPGIPQAAGHGAAIIRDGLHSLPIITAFRRAGKSIQHRRTVQVNTQCPQLTAHHTPNFVGVGGIARAGNDHGAGKNRGFAAQAGNTAALLVDGDKIEKLNTKTKETISPLVYPSWHPSGKYVAFSVNTTKQAFHLNDRNRAPSVLPRLLARS